MTTQIAEYLDAGAQTQGCRCCGEAAAYVHDAARRQKHDARMTTSAMLGAFRKDISTRMEFLDNISRGAEKLHF